MGYSLDDPVPGRPQLTFRQISRRAAEKIIKEDASFMALCRRDVKKDGVKIAARIMRDESEKSQVRLNALQYLTSYGYGTPRPMRNRDGEDDNGGQTTINLNVRGGLPPIVEAAPENAKD